jgi:hypothetical protein
METEHTITYGDLETAQLTGMSAAADYIQVDVYVAGAALDDKGLGAQRSQGVDECGVFAVYGFAWFVLMCWSHSAPPSVLYRIST